METKLLDRLFRILNILDLGPATIESIQKNLIKSGIHCSSRTIYRDLSRLTSSFSFSDLHINVEEGEFNKKKWMLVRQTDDSRNLSPEQYFRFFFLNRSKASWVGSVTGNIVQDLLINNRRLHQDQARKVGMNLSEDSVSNSDWGERIFREKDNELIRDLFWAIANKRVLSVDFSEHGQSIKKEFRPVQILKHRGTAFIIGWVQKNKEYVLEIYELDNFSSFHVTDKRLDMINEAKRVETEFGKRFGVFDSDMEKVYAIRLLISSDQSAILQSYFWHSSQKFKKDKNGNCIMEMKCQINSEMISWIFSWLEHIKVLDPPELRDLVYKKAKELASLYEKDV